MKIRGILKRLGIVLAIPLIWWVAGAFVGHLYLKIMPGIPSFMLYPLSLGTVFAIFGVLYVGITGIPELVCWITTGE